MAAAGLRGRVTACSQNIGRLASFPVSFLGGLEGLGQSNLSRSAVPMAGTPVGPRLRASEGMSSDRAMRLLRVSMPSHLTICLLDQRRSRFSDVYMKDNHILRSVDPRVVYR